MATLYVKTPNGTTKSIDLDTMNVAFVYGSSGYCKLPNALLFQWQCWTTSRAWPIEFTVIWGVLSEIRLRGSGYTEVITAIQGSGNDRNAFEYAELCYYVEEGSSLQNKWIYWPSTNHAYNNPSFVLGVGY